MSCASRLPKFAAVLPAVIEPCRSGGNAGSMPLLPKDIDKALRKTKYDGNQCSSSLGLRHLKSNNS